MKSRSARWRRVMMPLLVLLVVAVIAMIWTGSGQQSQVIGSGSTLAQPLIEQSAVAYRNARSADNPARPAQTGGDWVLDGSGIDYEPVGSLGGVMRLADPEVDFAVTDYPLSRQALSDLKAGQFPIAAGAVAVVHNLGLPRGQTLRLDAPTLAGIYQGRITRWTAPEVAALNDGVTLPDLPINRVYRSDGSGSTFGLTRYLAAGSPEWAQGPGANSSIAWPAGGTPVERSGGMLAAVTGTPGSIGYVEQGQARRVGLEVVGLRNGTGAFTTPTLAAMRAATTGFDFGGANDYVDLQPAADEAGAYPMTVAIYAVLERDPEYRNDTKRTLAYLRYLLDDYDASAQDLGYLPLPAEGAAAVQAYWTRTFEFAG